MDEYMFVAACPCGRRTLATKGSPALCVACLEKLFREPAANLKSEIPNPKGEVAGSEVRRTCRRTLPREADNVAAPHQPEALAR
jgi:hypothetical protein